MEKQQAEEQQQQPKTWIDKQANSPYPIWALSALCMLNNWDDDG